MPSTCFLAAIEPTTTMSTISEIILRLSNLFLFLKTCKYCGQSIKCYKIWRSGMPLYCYSPTNRFPWKTSVWKIMNRKSKSVRCTVLLKPYCLIDYPCSSHYFLRVWKCASVKRLHYILSSYTDSPFHLKRMCLH